MNDDCFEGMVSELEALGLPVKAKCLIARDTAQREALARAEAERDAMESMVVMLEEKEWAEHAGKGPVSERLETCITDLHNDLSEANERADTAQAQLAEAVGLLRAIDRDIWPEWDQHGSQAAALINVQAFLADYAQGEQQEALSEAELMDVAMFVGSGNKAARRASALGAAELPEHLAPIQEAQGAQTGDEQQEARPATFYDAIKNPPRIAQTLQKEARAALATQPSVRKHLIPVSIVTFENAITEEALAAGFNEPDLRRHEVDGCEVYVQQHIQSAYSGWKLALELSPAQQAIDLLAEAPVAPNTEGLPGRIDSFLDSQPAVRGAEHE